MAAGKSTTQRGYGSSHQRLRAHWQHRINTGEVITCWRPDCGRRITGTDWHLGHDDNDRSKYRGPECITCNLSAAGKKSHEKKPEREQQSRIW